MEKGWKKKNCAISKIEEVKKVIEVVEGLKCIILRTGFLKFWIYTNR